MAQSRPHLRRAAQPRFAAPVGAASSSMADIPIRTDPEMPTDTIEFQQDGKTVGAITNIGTPIQFPQYSAISSTLALDAVTVEDIDQLWDWVRADRDGTTEFLGYTHPNSQAFHKQIADIIVAEHNGSAWLRSIRGGAILIGFVALQIVKAPPTATIRLYLEPASHGHIRDVIAEVSRQFPNAMLMCVTTDANVAGIYVEAGFTSQYVVTRPPSGVTSHDRT